MFKVYYLDTSLLKKSFYIFSACYVDFICSLTKFHSVRHACISHSHVCSCNNIYRVFPVTKDLGSQIFLVEYFSEISWATELNIVIFAKLECFSPLVII